MTVKELLDFLETEGAEFELNIYQEIRVKGDGKGKGLCPICEACRRKTNRIFDNEFYVDAAAMLGLDELTAKEVALAADDAGDLLDSERATRAASYREQLMKRLVK